METLIKMTTEERISNEAVDFADSKERVLTSYHKGIVLGYLQAAKSERNKTIDEMLEKLDKGYKEYVWYKHLKEEINSLKV